MTIKTHYTHMISLVLFCSCTHEQTGDKRIENEQVINYPIEKDPFDSINLKDSSLRYDQLVVDQDLNCDDHFRKAFNREKPSRVKIIHCDYWDADHPNWLECAYSFELEKNDSFFQELINYNRMIPITEEIQYKNAQEDWFIPGELERYEGFYTEDDFDDFEIFRDRESGRIFIRGSES